MPKSKRKTKRFGDGDIPDSMLVIQEESGRKAPTPELPYKKNQICVDVKVVELRPDNDRSVGFVYAERDKTGAVKHEKLERGGRIIGLKAIWEVNVHWMTPGDFKSFLTDRVKVVAPVKEG